MRVSTAIVASALALVSYGCGGDDSATSSTLPPERVDPHFASISFAQGGRVEPKIVPPDLPPPKRMLMRDLRKGAGPIAKPGDVVGVWYRSVFYKSGGAKYLNWWPSAPYSFELGIGGTGEAFEEGIEGMREGGRRELVIPRHRMNGGAPMVYVVELVRLEPSNQ